LITAELAARVAEAYDRGLPDDVDHFSQLPNEYRARILAVAWAVIEAERARHRAQLEGLLACVTDALGESK